MAELDIKEGRPNVAVERLHPLLDRPGLLEADVTDFLPVLGWAYLQAGQIDQAKRVIEQAILRARGMNAWPNLAEALLVQTRIAVRDRDWQTAARSMAEGLDLAQTMSYPYAEARLLQQEGERLVTQGESKSARDRLARALAVFRQLGARREGEQIEHDIDALDRAIDASSHKSESCVHG
jgi:tetratricopeptide (TPR) repeat protein